MLSQLSLTLLKHDHYFELFLHIETQSGNRREVLHVQSTVQLFDVFSTAIVTNLTILEDN